jgi:uncharacterized surface protein with fasciclin (FAS1) repeats
MTRFSLLAAAVAAATLAGPATPAASAAMDTVMVGGHAMYPDKTIVANALNSADHTTLVAAVKAAGLVGVLNGKGPLTVFAPTNEAFADLPKGTVATLLKPQDKAELARILEYHVVAGDYDTTKLRSLILRDGGSVQLRTVEGQPITVMMNGSSNMMVKDAKGDVADITVADVTQSNGVIQVIDRVLLP